MEQTLRPYNPTWRDQLAQWVLGDQRPTAGQRSFVSGLLGSAGTGSTGASVVDMTPIGGLLSAQESAQRGDMKGAALAMLPMPAKSVNMTAMRRFHFSKPKNLFDVPAFDGATRIDDPAVIAALESAGWRNPSYMMLREDNSLTSGGRKRLLDTLQSANDAIIGKETVKQQKRFLKDVASQYADEIAGIHKSPDLNFTGIPISDFNASPSMLLHKSPNFNGRQSSEYRLMLVGDDPAYARKSNHWGKFTTNIKEGSPDAAGLGETDDPFGRVGYKHHKWGLLGGNDDAMSSQAGYLLLKDLFGW